MGFAHMGPEVKKIRIFLIMTNLQIFINIHIYYIPNGNKMVLFVFLNLRNENLMHLFKGTHVKFMVSLSSVFVTSVLVKNDTKETVQKRQV